MLGHMNVKKKISIPFSDTCMHIISTHTDSATVCLLQDLLLLFYIIQNATSCNQAMSNFVAALWSLEFPRS
jgi:hypothetical protein